MPYKSKEKLASYMRKYMRKYRSSDRLERLLNRRKPGELEALIRVARRRFYRTWRETRANEYKWRGV